MDQCEAPHRWVKAQWAEQVKEVFQANLRILASDRTGLLADLAIQLANMHIFIHNMDSRESKNGQAIVRFSIRVNGREHLQSIMDKLKSIPGILTVERI